MKIVVFTDLDGTLLDHFTYAFDQALPALDLLRRTNTPLVICTSKTASEIEHYRRMVKNIDPYVSENGGGVFIPRGYFCHGILSGEGGLLNGSAGNDERGCCILRLGAPYEVLRRAVEALRRMGYPIKGFGDMTPQDVSELTGLPLELSVLAKERNFDEPFIIEGTIDVSPGLVEAIEALGFTHTMGRFRHLMGNSDKGRAVALLTNLFRADSGEHITTIGIGDAPNDVPMLREVDYPVVVQQPDGSYGCGRDDVPGLIEAYGVGPVGWDRAIREIVGRLSGSGSLLPP
jgi:mannosyl-3-phosphoglycerate phosphatase family protein